MKLGFYGRIALTVGFLCGSLGTFCADAQAALVNSSGANDNNSRWETSTNWTPNIAPADGTFDDFVIGTGHVIVTPNNDTPFGTTTATAGPGTYDTLTIASGGMLGLSGNATSRTYTFASLTIDNGGTLGMAASTSNTANRNLTVANGTDGLGVIIGAGNVDVTINSATTAGVTRSIIISAPVSGSGNINRTGTGGNDNSFVLSGNNGSFTGSISSNQGNLVASHANALGDTTGSTTIEGVSGQGLSSLDLNAASAVFLEPVTLKPTGNHVRIQATQNNVTFGGPITISAGPDGNSLVRFEVASGRSGFILASDINGSSLEDLQDLQFRGAGSGEVTGKVTTSQGVFKYDAGTWKISNPNNDIARFGIGDGTITLGATNALGSSGEGPLLVMGHSSRIGTLQLNGFDQKVSGLNLNLYSDAQNNANSHNNKIDNLSATASTLTVRAATEQFYPGIITGNTNLVIDMVNPSDRMVFEPNDGAGGNPYGGSNLSYAGTTTVHSGIMMALGSMSTNGADKVFLAAPDDSFTDNPIIVRARVGGASYVGYGSQSLAGGGALGSSAQILAGENGPTSVTNVDLTIGMRWRQRTADEQAGGNLVVSDVFDLGGMVNSELGDINNPSVFAAGETDYFVLEMSYDESLFDEAAAIASGQLFLGWLDPDDSTWKNAVEGNFAGTSTFVPGDSTWTDFGSPGLADDLGRWGIDSTNNKVWAVLNHNSTFAVVTIPEPASIFMLGFGSLLFFGKLRNRSAKK